MTVKSVLPYTSRIIAQVMNKELDLSDPDMELRTLRGWDSMKHLQLVLTIEQESNSLLSPQEIEGLVALVDVENLARSRNLIKT